MSDPSFSIKYEDKAIQEALTKLLSKTSNLTPVMQEIGEYGIASVDLRFQQEVDPDGRPWKPLSIFTIRLKRSEGKILRILQRTGLMRSRVNYKITPTSCTIGINDAKAYKHQFGIGVPQRKILGINEEDKQEILNIINDYLEDI
ncbi:virion morphogenesis protein [Aphanizomenon phage vB_AphaS-CL131]|jgi:phage virion morphogenesis protein|nr:virion morphogenesis protein [Aphanizomenon phage vB_AphaS-CL131]